MAKQKVPKLTEGVRKSLQARAKTTKKYTYGDLAKVYRRGQGAYLGAGSRPGVSMSQWAFGRVNSFIRGGNHDTDVKLSAAKRRKR
tara:strand:- start:259 stop:516 length:258 start_codon:yes stop_codon:yes gene_type:complete